MVRVWGMVAVVVALFGGAAAAETCGGMYTVKRGDSLSVIADNLYKNARLWTAIYTNNIPAIGDDPDAIEVGQQLGLTCINGFPTGLPGGTPVSAQTAAIPSADLNAAARAATDLLQPPRIKLVTGDDFAPFTHRGLMNDGLLAEVVSAAMTAAVGPDGFDTYWINDWAGHLETMMPAHLMEMAFPWARPDCDNSPQEPRCVAYHFSQPMFEYLVLLYTHVDRPIPFAKDSDIEGRTLCRPAGYLTHMLDKGGRNWVSDGKITLIQPSLVATCFELLASGDVDGVVLNEFTARDAIIEMDLDDEVAPVQGRPISITALHVLVHKSHPQADALLALVNDGLATIRQTGQYSEIVGRHMEQIWASY